MFMHTFIEDLKLPPPIGIPLAHHISGRILALPPTSSLNDADVLCATPGFTIVLDISHSTIPTTARITSIFYRARLRSPATDLYTFRSYLVANKQRQPQQQQSKREEANGPRWYHCLLITPILCIAKTTLYKSIDYHHNCYAPIVANISSLLSESAVRTTECTPPNIWLLSVLYAVLFYSICHLRVSARRQQEGTFPDLNKCATSDSSCCFFDVNFVVKFTVRALYAGTLVVDRTTAPRHQPHRRNYFHCQPHRTILLAALFLVLATLTIAARCYASTNGADSIVQLSPNPQLYTATTTTTSSNIQLSTTTTTTTYSPIHSKTHQQQYSTSQLHTSNIVLSSLFIKPRKENLQSDISVIDETYSKLYSTNQNKRIRESYYYDTNEVAAAAAASKRRIKRSSYQLVHGTNRKHADGVVETPNQISTFQEDNSNVDNSPYLAYRTKQSKKIFPHHSPFTVDIYKDNVYATLPSVTIANEQVTIPRIRTTVSKASPVISSIAASVQNKSVIHSNHSSVLVNKSTFHVGQRPNNSTSSIQATPVSSSSNTDKAPSLQPPNKRPMPPGHGFTKDLLNESGGVLVLVAACLVLTLALGLVTCVLNHYRGGTVADPPDVAQTPTTAPMLSVVSAGATAGVGGMDRLRGRGAARELAANRDHQVRLHAVHTDIAINLPPSISLPDGEEHPFSSRLHLRDTEQESEIYQKCIRPPPNRTVLESESPPPYRSSSAGLLGSIGGSSSGSSNDWSGGSAPLVVRCHSMSTSSMSSTMKRPDAAGSSGQKTDFIQKTVKIFTGKKSQPSPAPTLPPVVIVPTRTRRTADPQQHLHLNHNHHHQQQNNYHSSHLHQPQSQHHSHHPQQPNNSTTGRPNSNV